MPVQNGRGAYLKVICCLHHYNKSTNHTPSSFPPSLGDFLKSVKNGFDKKKFNLLNYESLKKPPDILLFSCGNNKNE